MSRGGSYGGGPSSLGYLFSSDDQPRDPPPTRTVQAPPYGIDTTTDTDRKKSPPHKVGSPSMPTSEQNLPNNNYQRAQGQNLGNFVTDRPSTKVKSVPGGDSSLGYLFGDK
ncbi:Protein SPIRAL1-like [Quillaja saponaria]|uniref:Protein SPIRAL1-like n=1 Tax=Quillaja saponaria TaxID=32244 RepID=A0AAD7KSK4_QUISA|nr:Protein SPIRAL1-like [Quillaja saponaria]